MTKGLVIVKINPNFYLNFLCGTSNVFMKAGKIFIKSFEVPQRSVKENFCGLNFINMASLKMKWLMYVLFLMYYSQLKKH